MNDVIGTVLVIGNLKNMQHFIMWRIDLLHSMDLMLWLVLDDEDVTSAVPCSCAP